VDLAVGVVGDEHAQLGLAAIIKTLGGNQEQLAEQVEGIVR
jgi:hypothetical protein